ncbi:MAG TPA: hypothetical protein VGD31_15490 [Sphingobacteriaceae bacterium]
MKAADLNFNLVDAYFRLLENLSPGNKLELITKLSESLKGPQKSTEESIAHLYGSFKSSKTAEEIINDLNSSRNFTRTPPEL